jgi:hypothetical protein
MGTVDETGQLELLTPVEDYVFGFVVREEQLADFDVDEELQPELIAFFEDNLDTGELREPSVPRVRTNRMGASSRPLLRGLTP